ncbi:MAG: SagB family peptide dehydrogenase [Candidatus Heimdallarchaeota archaeon]|nr:SagB family peptide dehydrogenase [Candidatus Heimdallarchaeota archaeon]MCK5047876.1 SagB family peptide dehydrogenase [Candidatus Heimdallarchaeota archaeon]
MRENRKFLRFFNKDVYDEVVPESDEKKEIPKPLFQKDYPEDAELIDLISPDDFTIGSAPFIDLVNSRKSRRKYTKDPLSLEELSFLLWSSQGVKRVIKSGHGVIRTVPSSGAKSPFETYLVINRVEGLKAGLYRYISFEHKLMFIKEIEDAENQLGELSYGQKFVGRGAVVFCWIAVPYRTEWRYTILSHKFIAVDLGIVCQNLYMACEALKLGTVAIGYYEQEKIDELFELNVDDELTVLLAPVGKIPIEKKLSDFFEAPKSEASTEALRKLVGTYKRTNEVIISVEGNELVAQIGDFQETFETYNETEFIAEAIARAVKFKLNDEGKPEKMIVLTPDDEIVELEFIG